MLQKPSVCEKPRSRSTTAAAETMERSQHFHGKCEQLSNHEALDDEMSKMVGTWPAARIATNPAIIANAEMP